MLGIRRTLAVAAALASWSCGSTQPDATVAPVAAIVVNPPSSTLALNAQLPLQALVQDASGTLVPDASVTWTVENPVIASVSPAGVVTALALGTTQVAASARGKSGVATVTVQKTPVASVVVRPNRVDAVIGSNTQLTASALDAAQNTLADRAMIWTTSNAAVATVNATGVVKAVAAGTATITATSEGKSDASSFTIAPGSVARVDVTPAPVAMVSGQTQQLAASAKDASGTVLTGKTVIWASSNAAVASVSSTGVVTAVGAGSASITATVEGVSGSSAITVTAAPVGSVSVSPQTPTVMVGSTTQLNATVTDVNGAVVSGAGVTWASSNTGVATVSGSGVVTGVSAGTSTITASTGGKSGTTTVTVSLVAVKTVAVSPISSSLVPGQTQQLTATVTDANGNVTNRQVTWTSSNGSVATVDQAGLVTAVAQGNATITATSGGVTGNAGITVGAVPAASVTVSPTTLPLNIGQTGTLTATVKDAAGNVLTGRAVTWSTSSALVATVTQAGVVTALLPGSATITATSGTASGTATAVVAQPSVASVSVAPSSASIVQNNTTTLTATVKDAGGNTLTGQNIAWTTSDANVAVLSATSGQSITVTGGVSGTATITATSGEKSATSSITVTNGAPASVSLTLQSTTIRKLTTTTATAVVLDGQGRRLQGRTVSWSASGAATISPSTSTTSTGSASAATATVTGKSVSSNQTATITATISGKQDSAVLTVTP